jgi:hypothetical protein
MYPDQVRNYLREARRILSPSGNVFATFLLMNESWEALAREGKPTYPLPHELTDYARIMNQDDPLHAIAYTEDWVLEQFESAALTVTTPVRYGTWAGRDRGETFQDLVVGRAKGSSP